jgi:hypothetical protein
MRNMDPVKRQALGTALVMTAAVGLLRSMGRTWWCSCGELALWSGEIQSLHNSQHVFDPYTFTHLLHGVGFYGLFWLLRERVSPGNRYLLAASVESLWEVIENTSLVIERYRATTISLGYYGDSIVNSLADIIACMAGYGIAWWAPVWLSIAGFVGTEVFLLWWIRDSLLLNILNLICPIEAVKTWQAGG